MQFIEPLNILQTNYFYNKYELLIKNEMNRRLIVGNSYYTHTINNYIQYFIGLSLTFLALLPLYCYSMTFMPIPALLTMGVASINALTSQDTSRFYIYGITLLVIILWPVAIAMVLFAQIFLIALQYISPITLFWGIVSLDSSM